MGVGLCMEQFMNRTVEGGRGRRWMYSADGWLNLGGRRIGGLDCGWTNKRKGEVIVSAWNVSGIPGGLNALEGTYCAHSQLHIRSTRVSLHDSQLRKFLVYRMLDLHAVPSFILFLKQAV